MAAPGARGGGRPALRGPLRLEGRTLRGRKVAIPRPPRSKRQPGEPPARASGEREQSCRNRGDDAVEPRPPGEETPEGDAAAHGRRRQVPLELALAPRTHHARQRDADRAHLLAAPAERRGVGQMAGLVDADQARRQHGAHGPRIDPSVSMAADRVIDRAVVHAGTAPNAAQHVAKLARQHRGAAIVEQHHVVFPRPVGIAGATRAGRECGVDRHFLACRRARQHAQQLGEVFQRRHQLLDRGKHDVGLGQGLGEVAIALVGNDHRGAGLGDE